jgi:VanZ family protein
MQPLKAPFLWLALGWLLVTGACLGSLLPGKHIPVPGGYDKLLHFGTYFLLMVWFAGIYKRKRYPLIAIALLLLGLGLEVGQRLVISRAFDVVDLTANVTGIAIGFVLALTLLGEWCQSVERLLFGQAPGGS